MDKINSLVRSRRFFAAAVGLGVIVAKHYQVIPEDVSDEQVLAVAVLIAGWVLGESFRSSEKRD